MWTAPGSVSSENGGFSGKLSKKRLEVRVWTVNDEADMRQFIEKDLEAVITNIRTGSEGER